MAELDGLDEIVRLLRESGLEVAYDRPFMSAVGDTKQFIEFAKKLGFGKKDDEMKPIPVNDGDITDIFFVKTDGYTFDIARFKKNVEALATSCNINMKAHVTKYDHSSYVKAIWQVTVSGPSNNIAVFKDNLSNIDGKIISERKK